MITIGRIIGFLVELVVAIISIKVLAAGLAVGIVWLLWKPIFEWILRY